MSLSFRSSSRFFTRINSLKQTRVSSLLTKTQLFHSSSSSTQIPSTLSMKPQPSFPHSSLATLPSSYKRFFSSSSSSYSPSSPPLDFKEELSKKYFDSKAVESTLYSWWEKENYFKPKVEKVTFNKDTEPAPFVIAMPPPNVTGHLHMGHAIFLSLQDIMVRFHRMKGYNTLWIPGTDHAGIATQMLVDRQLKAQGISKDDLGREEFLKRVWQWKEEKGGYILNQMKRIGASADWSREKFTLDPDMNAAVTHAFSSLHEQGLIYKGSYMVNWSPVLQTAVSDLEVDYVEEEGLLYTFSYPLAEGGESIPVSTTRPETILGDSAVCVHPEDERFKHLIGQKVRVPMSGRLIPIIADTYVDPAFGTGALKVTPAHDINDYKLGKAHNLDFINILNKDGSLNKFAGKYEGLDRFEARKQIWKDLESSSLAISKKPHMQRVPRSQRSGEVIEPMISSQWFLKMDQMGKNASAAVRDGELRIVPPRFESTWFNWMDNVHDWCLSRQLWWGHRIPVYYVLTGTNSDVENNQEEPYVVASSEEEALQKARALYGPDVKVKQDDDVLDTWFSSGLWPFATLGWPHPEGSTSPSAQDFSRFFPGQVMETGHDILFFWVARMVTLSQNFLQKLPFHTIYLHGLVRDEHGQKMSKTKGNIIDPLEVIDEIGSDALRFSLIANSPSAGQDLNLSKSALESGRNFCTKLFNIGKFISDTVGKNSDGSYRVTQLMTTSEIQSLPVPEQYIVNACHKTVNEVTSLIQAYQFHEASKVLYSFMWDDLADWYLEVNKLHLRHGSETEKEAAVKTLLYVFDLSLRLLHPFLPYLTEVLWQNIPHERESLSMVAWPTFSSPPTFAEFEKNPVPPPPSLQVDEAPIVSFQKFSGIIRSIRNLRATYTVKNQILLPAVFSLSSSSSSQKDLQDLQNLLTQEAQTLCSLAKLDQSLLEIVSQNDKKEVEDKLKTFYLSHCPPAMLNAQAASLPAEEIVRKFFSKLVIEEGLEVYLPLWGLMDKEKEEQRLMKQQEKVEAELATLAKRLDNPSFVAKAPPHLLQQSEDRRAELLAQIASLSDALRDLRMD